MTTKSSRTSRGRFAGQPVAAPNPGMNPFVPQAKVRLEDRWRLGDVGAVYEFNIKLGLVEADVSNSQFERDAERALVEFEQKLRQKYPWIGRIYRTGRSGGWLAVEDPKGKMTKAALKSIAERVAAGKRQFVHDMERAWPRRAT
jgi:hypothetical protein